MKLSVKLSTSNLCDYENSEIKKLSKYLKREGDEIETIKAIFIYVRDKIKFSFDHVYVKASETLQKGHGACWNKALLLTTLLHSSNIDARIVFDPLKNNFSKPCFGIISYLSNNPFNHGLVQVSINGKWVRIDPTLDINTFNHCFKSLPINWSIDWDQKNDMQLYLKDISGKMVVIEDIESFYKSNFGNSIPPKFIMNYMNRKLWSKSNNI